MKVLSIKELAKSISEGRPANCYLFYGEEKYLINLYVGKMKDFIGARGEASVNIDVFRDRDSVSSILGATQTTPFLCDYRLVIVKNSGLFETGRKDDSKEMSVAVKNLPDSVIAVFTEDSVDKRSVMYKAVLELGGCVEFKKPSDSDLATWVVREMKAQNIAIEKGTALYLIRTAGAHMENLSGEMAKLAANCGPKKVVNAADIDSICTKGLEVRVFGLVDALAMKNTGAALQIFYGLMEAKESPIMVLSLIARQFRLMLGSAQMKGRSTSEIGSALGAPPFAIKECIKQAANFKEAELVQALKDCLKADTDIKTGKIGDKLALETLIVKYGA